MDDAFYFGQGRLASYNRFTDDDNGINVKKKGVLYRTINGMLSVPLSPLLSGISNFQIYNKSVLRYKANATTDIGVRDDTELS
jgi:hypothetical protein